MKKVWTNLKLMSGYTKKGLCQENSQLPDPSNGKNKADNLNKFYTRFDDKDFSHEHDKIRKELLVQGKEDGLKTDEVEVRRLLKGCNPGKASGPDGVSPHTLKNCADQLAYIFTVIFNQSFMLGKGPKGWKTSAIIPVPKRAKVTQMNDLRPVA